jgi:hypothetical protein
MQKAVNGTRGKVMKSKTRTIVGWVMSGLLSAFLIIASATPKFIDWEGKEEMFAKSGYSIDTMAKIGIVEVIAAVLILIPRTSFVGGLLLTAYLGGATATHVRVGEPFYVPILVGVFLWVSLGLRQPKVFSLAIGAPEPT